jgi:hypothetical protein
MAVVINFSLMRMGVIGSDHFFARDSLRSNRKRPRIS